MDWFCLKKTEAFLTLFLVFILHIDAQDEANKCPVFKVVRGTIHKICLNQHLKISCNLNYCNNPPTGIIWTKAIDADLKKWNAVNTTHQISTSKTNVDSQNIKWYLNFTNISKLHEGFYRCEPNLTHISLVSHYINVLVSDNCTGSKFPSKMSEADSSYSGPWWLPYLLICSAVVLLVLMVTFISILCIIGFKCSSKKVSHRAQVPNPEELLQYNHELQTSPPQRTTVNKSDGDKCSVSYTKDNQKRQVIYASLKDFKPSDTLTASCKTSVEYTVYAPIRVS